jgi:transposase
MSKQNAAGVDTHRDTHSIAIIDSGGQILKQWTISATVEGYQQAIADAVEFGDVVWGIEGTGSYGRGFADSLLKAGATVYEVPGNLTKRHRRHSSRKGKSDQQDAQAIAEVVLREGDRLPRVEQLDEQEAIRLLYDRRDRCVRSRTESINRLRAGALRLALRDLPQDLTSGVALDRYEDALRTVLASSHTSRALIDEMSDTIADVRRLNSTISALERRLIPFVSRLVPDLIEMRGVSTVVAAGLVGHAGNLNNCRNADAFAMRAGVAPVSCSSGRSDSVRVNTGGNRQLNRCLHIIALTQIRSDGHVGKVYYDRKRSEGKAHRSALRALKRQLATVVFLRLKTASTKVDAAAPAAIAA